MSFWPSPIKEDVDFVIQDGNDCIGGLFNSLLNSSLNSPTYTINSLPHSSPLSSLVAKPFLAVAKPFLVVAKPFLVVAKPLLAVAKPLLAVAKPFFAVAKLFLVVAKLFLVVVKLFNFLQTLLSSEDTILYHFGYCFHFHFHHHRRSVIGIFRDIVTINSFILLFCFGCFLIIAAPAFCLRYYFSWWSQRWYRRGRSIPKACSRNTVCIL